MLECLAFLSWKPMIKSDGYKYNLIQYNYVHWKVLEIPVFKYNVIWR